MTKKSNKNSRETFYPLSPSIEKTMALAGCRETELTRHGLLAGAYYCAYGKTKNDPVIASFSFEKATDKQFIKLASKFKKLKKYMEFIQIFYDKKYIVTNYQFFRYVTEYKGKGKKL